MTLQAITLSLITSAAGALSSRVDEVNKLNVFPVPDGDTGTNMALTIDAVITAVKALPADADQAALARAITQGSLMGARGNSGVILSQIIRGICEVLGSSDSVDAATLEHALRKSVSVSFQAVRKPVEGTILTVLRDSSDAATSAIKEGVSFEELADIIVAEAFASVRRTPDLLPVLKENGVVDAGGYGLAILAEGILAAHRCEEVVIPSVDMAEPNLVIEPQDDWDDDEFLYCTEFLLFGDTVDREAVLAFVQEHGGSELVVGDAGQFKVHVHTNDPGTVISFMTSQGEVSDVHVNNMRLQTAQRSADIARDQVESEGAERKDLGVVSVASGDGLKAILTSLGADVVISGGQTMNPSTAEILEAIEKVNSEAVIVLPNNKNIILAAQQAAEHSAIPVRIVPTVSVPQGFTALLELNMDDELDVNAARMSESLQGVRTGEVTLAVKDSSTSGLKIKAGDIIGIADDEIRVQGADVVEVAIELMATMIDDAETVTLLAGEDLTEEQFELLQAESSARFPTVEFEAHRGDQPLYPIIFSVE